jgi:hypothetical protein
MIIRILLSAALLAGFSAAPRAAHAAQSYDNCTGFIDTLPATISTQGTWCLRHDLATKNTSGIAVNINANNVTIDCNDFKIGGLSAGTASKTNGIYAFDRQNITVRRCNVRGFNFGVWLYGGAGHLVENNRLDDNLVIGINVIGEHNRVFGNAVYDTGGATGGDYACGICAKADIVDNTVDGVFTDADTFNSIGIGANAVGALVSGNRVSGLQVKGAGTAYGISSINPRQRIVGNFLRGADSGTALSGWGIYGSGAVDAPKNFCIRNVVVGFNTGIGNCQLVDNATD